MDDPWPTLRLLNRVHDYACAALVCNALSAGRLRPFASTPYELLGQAPSEVSLRLKPTSDLIHPYIALMILPPSSAPTTRPRGTQFPVSEI